MLVGDVILGIREAVTDQPPTLGSPGLVSAVGYNDAFGNIPAGNYYLQITQVTPWGESSPSNEVVATVTPGTNAITLNISGLQGGTDLSGITNYRVYIGYSSGAESFWVPFSGSGISSFNLTSIVPNTGGPPPQRSTAYFPDADGDAISAYTMFRWLCDALKLASSICGGLLDYGGLGTVSGVPQYIIPGSQWRKISSLWYDGYPLAMDDSGNYFRRNSITASILASVATSLLTDRMMFEVWPQPSRTAALTTMSTSLIVGSNLMNINSIAGFLLTNGFVAVDPGLPTFEIMSYSGIGGSGTLNNLIRGLGGTTEVNHAINANVQELNMFWQGWRQYSPIFKPGDSLKTIPVPVGWETTLFEYGLGRAKLAEQGIGDYEKLNDMFSKKIKEYFMANKVTTGPRQILEQSNGLETFPSLGGGWIVP